MDRPGVPRSIRKAENFSPSIFPKTVNRSANPLLLIHIFSPLRIQWRPSGERTARVRQFSASDPEVDSDSA